MNNESIRKTSLREKGITLVALVVTIIILLILAGVAITSVTGDNGLFAKAREARKEAEISEIVDSAKMDVLAKQVEKADVILKDKELKTILEKYGTLSDEGETSILDKTLKTTEGEYEIDVRRIYDGELIKSEMVSCTICGVTVHFEKGMRWNPEFLSVPSEYDREDVSSIIQCWDGPRYSAGEQIIGYKTSAVLEVALTVEGDNVCWDDEVIPNAVYVWTEVD